MTTIVIPVLIGRDHVDITRLHEPGPLVAALREANESEPTRRPGGFVWLFRLGSADADRTLAVGARTCCQGRNRGRRCGEWSVTGPVHWFRLPKSIGERLGDELAEFGHVGGDDAEPVGAVAQDVAAVGGVDPADAVDRATGAGADVQLAGTLSVDECAG